MNHHYSDITDRIPEPPQWWDENAVPRYCEFTPDGTADIYAREAVLLLIECQSCGTPFKVCMSWHWWPDRETSLREWIAKDEIHYGDPPNANCCPAGPTMNSIPRRVLEFWDNSDVREGWKRMPEFEREIACEWAKAGRDD